MFAPVSRAGLTSPLTLNITIVTDKIDDNLNSMRLFANMGRLNACPSDPENRKKPRFVRRFHLQSPQLLPHILYTGSVVCHDKTTIRNCIFFLVFRAVDVQLPLLQNYSARSNPPVICHDKTTAED